MQPNWNMRGLIGSYAIAALLTLTYLCPPTSALWDSLDVHVALALNSIVRNSHTQQMIWAFANLRVSDFIAAAIMLAVVVYYVITGTNAPRAIRAARMIATCVFLILLVAFTRQLLFHDISKDSPSLVLDHFTLLSEKTSLDPKDHSESSFPGDHATVLATFTFLLWYFAGLRYGLVCLLLAMLFVLPRLVSGAHWLSDVMIGGGVTALVTVPVVVFTPVETYLVSGLVRLFPRQMRSVMTDSKPGD